MFPYRKKITIKKYKNYQLICAQYCRECSYKITKKKCKITLIDITLIPSDPKLLKISSLIFQENFLIHNTKQIGQQHQVKALGGGQAIFAIFLSFFSKLQSYLSSFQWYITCIWKSCMVQAVFWLKQLGSCEGRSRFSLLFYIRKKWLK